MIDLLAIDPGTRNLGWAAFEGGLLIDAGASISPKTATSLMEMFFHHVYEIPAARDAVVEYMAHHHGRAASQPNTLLAVQWMGGVVAGRLAKASVYALKASEWKGNIPKQVHHKRIAAALKETELSPFSAALANTRKSNHKEVIDAVGIGLYHLNRTDKAGRSL